MDEQASRHFQRAGIRRHYPCRLEAGRASTAVIQDISGRGALVETAERPPLGSPIGLHHPQAGFVRGNVCAHARAGIAVAFSTGPQATAFALAVIASGTARRAA